MYSQQKSRSPKMKISWIKYSFPTLMNKYIHDSFKGISFKSGSPPTWFNKHLPSLKSSILDFRDTIYM